MLNGSLSVHWVNFFALAARAMGDQSSRSGPANLIGQSRFKASLVHEQEYTEAGTFLRAQAHATALATIDARWIQQVSAWACYHVGHSGWRNDLWTLLHVKQP